MSDLGRGIDESRTNEAIGIVDFALRTQKLLLTSLVREVSADLVTVFLSLEQRDQVQAGPDLLAGELVLFADTVEELVVAVGHEEVHSNEVVDGSEAAGREVTLVLYRRIAPRWGHILRHGDD